MNKTGKKAHKRLKQSLFQSLVDTTKNNLRKIFIKEPHFDELGEIATIYRLKELDSSWTVINPRLKLWRYSAEIPDEIYDLDYLSRFRPLLLVHGYQSNHITWNWMVNKLWKDGFRIIFAFELDDYKKGFNHNMSQIISVVDYIREIEPIFKKIDIIGHSMGGIISKYYIKLFGGASKVRLFISLGAPLTGVYRFWKVLASIDEAEQTAIDFSDTDGVLSQIDETMTDEILYTLTQIHILGSLRRYLGSDGFFKIKPVHDMVNIYFPVKHTALNKDTRIYNLIKDFFLRKAWFYKIRLLYIQYGQKEKLDEGHVKETKDISFRFQVKGRRTERYPRKKDMIAEKGEVFLPTDPIFVFAGFSECNVKTKVTFRADMSPDRQSTEKTVDLALDSNVSRYVELVTLILSTNTSDEIQIQFAIYMYHLSIFTY